MKRLLWIPRALGLGGLAFLIFGPISNLLLWVFAEKWFYPHALPTDWGFGCRGRVFSPRGGAWEALARLPLPARALILISFLIPQAFPNLTVHVNIARAFYQIGLNGTIAEVAIVHTVHGLVPLTLFTAAAGGNYRIASITALVPVVPSVVFMLAVERFLKADMLSRIGK